MEQNSTDSSQAKVVWEIPEEDLEWEELHKLWADQPEEEGFISQVQRGREGLNEGMDNGLKRINTYIHGTHRGRYILIGADSGVGKTTLADFMYVYSLWRAAKRAGIRLYVKYFSFEISATEKKAKWVAQWIRAVYREDLPTDYIMGRIAGMRLEDRHMKMVMRAYAIVEEVLKDVTIIDYLLHPTGMLNRVIEEHFEKIGTVIRDTPKEGKKKGMIKAYRPKDPTAMTVVITDHLALINGEAGAMNTKAAMDRWSLYSVQLRNIFRCTLVQIQQFSTSMMSAYREQKRTEVAIAPQRLDFGDSTYTYRDADLVFGLVKPIQYNLPVFHGYNLEQLGPYFVAMYLMKNRYGPADRMLPLFMNPISGMFYDIPSPHSDLSHFDTQAKYLDDICQAFNSPQGPTPSNPLG
jgi:replicative DNA helicase